VGAGADHMQRIYDAARARGVQFGAVINRTCAIIEETDEAITLGFVHEAVLRRALQPPNLKVLVEAASEALGRPVDVHCVHEAAVTPWTPETSRSPLVRAAQEMGARVVSRTGEEK